MSAVMTLKRYGASTFGKIGARRMMWSVNNLLPKGARWVEYLGSTESQWIDTGLILSAQDSVGLRVGIKAQSSLNLWLLGCKTSFSSVRLTGFRVTSSTSLQGYIDGTSAITVSGDNIGQTYDVVMSNGTWIVNGVSGTATTPVDCVNKLTLFGWNHSTNAETVSVVGLSAINLYRFYVARGNKRTIDLCPIAIGTTGYMLDLVSGEYLPYGNQGTGDFVIGPDINAPAI